jgi:hypothetical protein
VFDFDITWVNKPPIVETNAEACQALFRHIYYTWETPGDPSVLYSRVKNCWSDDFEDEKSFAYMILGNPVGWVRSSKLKERRSIFILGLVTHPGSKSGGSILIEHVVNRSEKAGYEGRVELRPTNRWKQSFESKGFVEAASTGLMKLLPAESDQWVKLGEEWRLRKCQHEKKFAGSCEDLLNQTSWRRLTMVREISGSFRQLGGLGF